MKHMDRLRELHVKGAGVVVPNPWDAASAKVIATLDFPTQATSSAAVAWAVGYADGQFLPFDRLVDTVRAISSAIDVPLTVDAEGGYVEQTGGIERTVERLVEAGAAGVNFEDGDFEDPTRVRSAEQHAERIAAARAAAESLGVPLWINGRTDVMLKGAGDAEEAARRLALYAQAGSDCTFAPGLAAPDDVRRVADAIDAPLNVMWMPGMASASELAELGVARITVGAGMILAAVAAVERAAAALREGRFDELEAARPGGDVMRALLTP